MGGGTGSRSWWGVGVGVVAIVVIVESLLITSPVSAATESTSTVTAQQLGAVGRLPGDWRLDMLHRINGVRRASGVASVRLCPALQRASQDYAQAMARTDTFGHVGVDGRFSGQRVRAAGYAFTATGENIAGGFPTVAQVMVAWITSPGHFANLVDPAFTHVGLGYDYRAGTHFRTYWVQEFGAGGRC